MVNCHSCRKSIVVIAGLLVLALSLSSCDTLKQKFIRKKKAGAEDQDFVPVLEPEEYPEPRLDPEFNYKEHYDLIKAWYNDLWTAVDEKGSPTRYTHYVINQVSGHIVQMEKLVDPPTQANLVKLNGLLDYYRISLDSPEQMRNISRIESDLRAFDRLLRDHLRDDRIKGHFVKVMPVPAASSTPSTSS